MQDLSGTVQPVLQTILLGQLLNNRTDNTHQNNLLMTRFKVRPFTYFPEHDVMLTTKRAYVWRNEKQIMLRGCVLIATLLRFKEHVRIPPHLWKLLVNTEFMEASKLKW